MSASSRHDAEGSRRRAGPRRDRRGGRPDAGRPTGFRAALEAKRPVIRFGAIFAVCMLAFYLIEITPLFLDRILPYYAGINARISGFILETFREEVTVQETSIFSMRASLDVRHGCDALLPTALLVSAILASPVRWRAMVPGVLAGTAVILLLNIARIVTLYYARVYVPGFFDRMHLEVWPAIFILASLSLWVVWALRARATSGRTHGVPA